MQAHIELLLRQKIGLDAKTIGSSTISLAIKQRMQTIGINDIKEYCLLLQQTSQEWQLLIEVIVIPETWFLRDKEPFLFLQEFIKKEYLKQRQKLWRILSIPCSTGEEPYSIAISLLEAGLLGHQFTIDAFDVSYRSLEKAKMGIYTKNSFRGVNNDVIDRYFDLQSQGYELKEMIKRQVKFSYGNILEFNSLNNYDIAFCRNLLIYFDRGSRAKAIDNLAKALTEKGLLFIGHSESGCLIDSPFVGAGHPKAFVFRKENRASAKPTKPTIVKTSPSPPPVVVAEKEKTTEASLLKQAQTKADNNDFSNALTLCQTYIKQNPLDSDAHTLLGEIYQAQGEIQTAMGCYQKALYLNPNQYSALVHLMLIKQQLGDRAGALILQQRIDRLAKGNQSS